MTAISPMSPVYSRKAISHALRWAGFAGLLCLAGCGWQGFVHDEVLVGPYRLVAVDVSEDMSLCRSYGESRVGDGLPGPTVFQAGADPRYIVVARHPRRGDRADRSITEFYYIVRQADESNAVKPVTVKGPFNEREYQEEKRRL